MGIFDWLGPLNRGSRSGGWGDLPAPIETATASIPARKASPPPIDGFNTAFTIRTLVHGPGASDLLYGQGAEAGNSAVYACLQAIASAIAEPELRVYQTGPAERVELERTPLGALLARPNPYFSLDDLLAYVSDGLHCTGNAYWRKLRAGDSETGNVVELWPIAPTRIEPVTEHGSSNFIDYYRYWKGSTSPEIIAVENIVHFRNGISDRDHRLGAGPLARLTREVSADDRATRYADRLLANLGVAGLSLEFDKESPAIDQATADELKTRLLAAYGGDAVGSTAVLSPGAKLVQHGFSPEQLDLKVLHRVPEERIAAVLGVPAIVAGLGAGLDRSTFANVKEAREQFTENKLIPLWSLIASAITMSLVPDFSSDPSIVVDFDLSSVRALSDDQTALATRLQTLVSAGIIDADEARTFIGLEPRGPGQTPAVVRLPGAASRRELRALPGRSTKAAEDLPRRYEELRDDDLPDWESELLAFLEGQLRRITRRLRAGADTATDLVPEGEAVLLGETLTPLQLRTLGTVSRLVEAELGISFSLDDPATREYLRRAGANIVGITDHTRSVVADELTAGQAEGEGIEQLARRIRDLPAFGQARAETIARTELGTSQQHAAIASYKASGVVVGVRIHDGDYDAACQAMDGRTFALGSEPAALEHPNCTRSYAPIVYADEMTRSA